MAYIIMGVGILPKTNCWRSTLLIRLIKLWSIPACFMSRLSFGHPGWKSSSQVSEPWGRVREDSQLT